MEIQIFGIELWIIGIIVAILGYVIPQAMLREHPRNWAREAQIISAFFVGIGVIIAIATRVPN